MDGSPWSPAWGHPGMRPELWFGGWVTPPATPEVARVLSFPAVASQHPSPAQHPLLSLLPMSILPQGEPTVGVASMGTSQLTGRTTPHAPGRAESCTQEHRSPPGAAKPMDLSVPVSPGAVLRLCPFASPWAPQPGAAPHPQPEAGCPFPLAWFCTPQPPLPTGCPPTAGLVPTVTTKPPLPLSPALAALASLQPLQGWTRGAWRIFWGGDIIQMLPQN